MKSHMHARASGSSSSSTVTGSLPYISERQTQAYLMARDVIRRFQRSSSIVNSISDDTAQRLRAVNRSQNSH